MSAGNRDEYRRTIFDRHGPEAAQLVQTVSSLSIPVVAGALVGGALAARKGFPTLLIVVSMFGGSLIFAVWWWFFVTRLSHGAGRTFSEFLQPSAAGSYERQYSREDALVMRGDVEGALNVGIAPVLIDRNDRFKREDVRRDVPIITALDQLLPIVDARGVADSARSA